ncbi:MAG: repeat-associated core domain protein [Chloroflexi bacterium]|nr:repeat-associated core domain protein [Chloroflexota bacterium]
MQGSTPTPTPTPGPFIGGPPPETEFNGAPYGATGGFGVQTFTGSFSTGRVDLDVPTRGGGLSFARTYNSNDTRVGPLGPGWTHSYATRLNDAGDGSGALILVGPSGRSDRYALGSTAACPFPTGGAGFLPPPGVETCLARNADGTFTATTKDQSTFTFDLPGKLIRAADRYGNTTTLTYSGTQLTTVSSPSIAVAFNLTYDATSGRLTQVSGAPGVVRFIYDSAGRLSETRDTLDAATHYGYDGTSSRILTITDANNHVQLTNTYDAQGRVATQKDALGLTTGNQLTFTYQLNAGGARVTVVTGLPSSFEPSYTPYVAHAYDAQGRIDARYSYPTSTEQAYSYIAYDGNAFPISVTDAGGNNTLICYDVGLTGATIAGSRGNPTRTIGPSPTAGAARPVSLAVYDAKNNVIESTPPLGVASTSGTTCATNLTGAVNANYTTSYGYDAAGAKLLSATQRYTDPDSPGTPTVATAKYEYGDTNNPGRVSKYIPPRGNTAPTPDYSYAISFTYDVLGLVASVTDALGNKTTTPHDGAGRLTSLVGPKGNAPGANPTYFTYQWTYNSEGSVTSSIVPAAYPGQPVPINVYGYDPAGNHIVVTDASGQQTRNVYDARNSLIQVQASPSSWTGQGSPPPADAITTEFIYDASGNSRSVTRAKGSADERRTDYLHDGAGRVRRETEYPSWPSTSGALVRTATYDIVGNVVSRTDPLNQTTTYAYDGLTRLTGITSSTTSCDASRRRPMGQARPSAIGTTVMGTDGRSSTRTARRSPTHSTKRAASRAWWTGRAAPRATRTTRMGHSRRRPTSMGRSRSVTTTTADAERASFTSKARPSSGNSRSAPTCLGTRP